MDINALFKRALGKCKRVLKILPPDEIGGSITNYLQTILLEDTLPSLDILIPYQFQISFKVGDLIPVSDPTQLAAELNCELPSYDDRYALYRIPKKLTRGRGIMEIKSIVPPARNSNDAFAGFPTGVGIGSTMTNQFGRYSSATMYELSCLSSLSYLDGMLAGQTQVKFRTYFYQPNLLWIVKPYGVDKGLRLTACFLLKNDPSLLTVPDVSFEKVAELFVLDVRARIYNEFGYISEIETPYGTTNSGISDWSGCEAERKELFDTLQNSSHLYKSAMKS